MLVHLSIAFHLLIYDYVHSRVPGKRTNYAIEWITIWFIPIPIECSCSKHKKEH